MSKSTTPTSISNFLAAYPWRSVLLVLFIAITFAFNSAWIWGLFWIWWSLSSARAGEFVFIDVVSRTKHPYLFWIMVICWLLVGLSYFVYEFFPAYLEY